MTVIPTLALSTGASQRFTLTKLVPAAAACTGGSCCTLSNGVTTSLTAAPALLLVFRSAGALAIFDDLSIREVETADVVVSVAKSTGILTWIEPSALSALTTMLVFDNHVISSTTPLNA